MNISLRLKIYEATLWHYHQLYLKEYAAGGILDYEIDELKDMFVDVMQQAEELMRSFVQDHVDNLPETINEIIDYISDNRLIRYVKKWKLLYSGLYRRIIENRMVANDRRNLFDAYDVLSSLDTSSMIWQIKIGQIVEFLYYEFSDSHSCVSLARVVPKEIKYDKDRDAVYLVVEDVCKLRQTYQIDLIISADSKDIQDYLEDNNHGEKYC